MQKKFLSNLFITLLTNLVVKPFWIFGIDRTVQNQLGPDQYGKYITLFTLSLLLSTLLDLGINNYNATSLAKNPKRLHTQFGSLILIKSGFALVYFTATLAIGWWYGFGSDALILLTWMAANQILAYFSTFMRSTLTGLQQYRKEAWISSVDRLTMSIAGVLLLWYTLTPMSIQTFVWIQTVGYATAMLVSALATLPYVKSIGLQLSFAHIAIMLKAAFPYALLALLMVLYTKADVLLLEMRIANANYENGIYAQGTRLVEAANMFAVMVSSLLLPMFASISRKSAALTELIKLATVVLWIPCVAGVAFAVVYAPKVMTLLYTYQSPYSIEVFRWILWSILPMATISIFGTLLTAKGYLRLLIQTATIAALGNGIANWYFIPANGALACAIINVVTGCVVATVYLTHGNRLLTNAIPKMYWLRLLTLLFVLFGFALVLWVFDISLLQALIVFSLGTFASVLMLKLVSIAQIQKNLPILGIKSR